MGKNRKIKKKIKGLERAKKEHQDKKNTYQGNDEYLVSYWEKEIGSIDNKLREERRKLKK